MKVCVFSSPRTGSMLITNALSEYLGLTNYGETFSYGTRTFDVDYHRLMRLVHGENYVVKITPTSFHHGTFLQPDILPWTIFDKIVILSRKNIVQQVASWMVLEYAHAKFPNAENVIEQTSQILKNVEQIQSPVRLFRYALRCINEFYKIQKHIQSQNKSILYLTHEELNTNLNEYIVKLNTFFQVEFTKEHIQTSSVNFTGVNYEEFIQYKQLNLKCRSVIDEDGLLYLQEEINRGNIIC